LDSTNLPTYPAKEKKRGRKIERERENKKTNTRKQRKKN
jgi:hypothetical protein